MKAALIATGDEVVAGQIVNTNASYLASKLSEIGVEVIGHFAVPDKEENLKEIFNFLTQNKSVDVVLTIGGLGPTRDDLTRQVIADYSKKELELNSSIWTDMKCDLTKRSIQPRKGHKWQAYFPENATIFKNARGTAQSFLTAADELKIIAIPGPPNELESVLFDGGLLDWFKKRVLSNVKLLSWQCINIPESELAHEVEKSLEDCPFQIGYRASPPITEVKLWVDVSDEKADDWVKKLDKICEPALYSKNGYSYVGKVIGSFKELSFIDKVTMGQGLDEIKKMTPKSTLKNFSYAFGSKFKSDTESMIFTKKDEDFYLEFGEKKVSYSLKGKKLFRSKKANIFAMLMLFKIYYLEFVSQGKL